MESTVVEVGISSDIPQSQQIVEMVQGAVQAALRRSGNTNVTLVQLPTVYSSNENDANNAAAATANIAVAEALATDTDATASTEAGDSASTTAATVVIEDVIGDDENTPTNEPNDNSSTTATASAGGASSQAGDSNDNAAGGNNEDGNDNSRRRTGTPVLAGVIEQMRNVQNRLNPFIQQYYELLQNEPTFEEDVSLRNIFEVLKICLIIFFSFC